MASGDNDLWHRHAEALEARGLGDLQQEDGWLDTSKPNQSLAFLESINMTSPISYVIDWPIKERDNYDCSHRATAVNAWFVRSQEALANGFEHCELHEAAERCRQRAGICREAIIRDAWRGKISRFVDGPDSEHASVHANLFSLSCGVFRPGDPRGAEVASWLAKIGMVCSAYAAQYLIEALFQFDQVDAAHELLSATGPRSWHGMIEQGSTMCMEAWSDDDKPNQDWNHAWGGAPANLIPRWIAGVRPTSPGWRTAVIQAQPGTLETFTCDVPTPYGLIKVDWDSKRSKGAQLQLEVPSQIAFEVIDP